MEMERTRRGGTHRGSDSRRMSHIRVATCHTGRTEAEVSGSSLWNDAVAVWSQSTRLIAFREPASVEDRDRRVAGMRSAGCVRR